MKRKLFWAFIIAWDVFFVVAFFYFVRGWVLLEREAAAASERLLF